MGFWLGPRVQGCIGVISVFSWKRRYQSFNKSHFWKQDWLVIKEVKHNTQTNNAGLFITFKDNKINKIYHEKETQGQPHNVPKKE